LTTPRQPLVTTYKNGQWTFAGKSEPAPKFDLEHPIFVLTCARSGSTLIRFILDTHPDLGCPPETGFGAACENLAQMWGVLEGISARGVSPVMTRTGTANEAIRRSVHTAVACYLDRTGKKRWCDKSLNNIVHAQMLAQMWPEARFICLTRHCMDVIFSGIEAARWGLTGFGMRDHAIRNPGNSVAALADYWLEYSERMLRFESEHPQQCYRLRYEDLVARPEEIVAELFGFLGVRQVPGITESCFESAHEASGPGDEKIWLTSRIHAESVGRGIDVPTRAIPPRRLEQINAALGELGYPLVTEDWSSREHALELSDLTARPDLIPPVTSERIAQTAARWPQLRGRVVSVAIREDSVVIDERSWRIEDQPGSPAPDQADLTILGELAAWQTVFSGAENLAAACLSARLRIIARERQENWTVIPEEAHAIAFLLGLDAVPTSQAPLAAAAAEFRRLYAKDAGSSG
jgi:hypothetical protein